MQPVATRLRWHLSQNICSFGQRSKGYTPDHLLHRSQLQCSNRGRARGLSLDALQNSCPVLQKRFRYEQSTQHSRKLTFIGGCSSASSRKSFGETTSSQNMMWRLLWNCWTQCIRAGSQFQNVGHHTGAEAGEDFQCFLRWWLSPKIAAPPTAVVVNQLGVVVARDDLISDQVEAPHGNIVDEPLQLLLTLLEIPVLLMRRLL